MIRPLLFGDSTVKKYRLSEALPPDNGERFFSEHLTATIPSMPRSLATGALGECLCNLCSATTPAALKTPDKTVVFEQQQTEKVMATTVTIINTTNNVNVRNRQQASQPARSTAYPASIPLSPAMARQPAHAHLLHQPLFQCSGSCLIVATTTT